MCFPLDSALKKNKKTRGQTGTGLSTCCTRRVTKLPLYRGEGGLLSGAHFFFTDEAAQLRKEFDPTITHYTRYQVVDSFLPLFSWLFLFICAVNCKLSFFTRIIRFVCGT